MTLCGRAAFSTRLPRLESAPIPLALQPAQDMPQASLAQIWFQKVGLTLGHIPKVHIPKPRWWGGNKPRTAEDLSNRRPLRSRSLSVAAKTEAAVLLFAYIFNYMDLEPLTIIQPTVDRDVTSSGGSSS